jgi:Mg/Co/Ni transporter MgtE
MSSDREELIDRLQDVVVAACAEESPKERGHLIVNSWSNNDYCDAIKLLEHYGRVEIFEYLSVKWVRARVIPKEERV